MRDHPSSPFADTWVDRMLLSLMVSGLILMCLLGVILIGAQILAVQATR